MESNDRKKSLKNKISLNKFKDRIKTIPQAQWSMLQRDNNERGLF